LQVEALPKCQITAAHTINLSLYFLYGQRNEATSNHGGRGGDTRLYSNLKVIAVPVLTTILHMVSLTKVKVT